MKTPQNNLNFHLLKNSHMMALSGGDAGGVWTGQVGGMVEGLQETHWGPQGTTRMG